MSDEKKSLGGGKPSPRDLFAGRIRLSVRCHVVRGRVDFPCPRRTVRRGAPDIEERSCGQRPHSRPDDVEPPSGNRNSGLTPNCVPIRGRSVTSFRGGRVFNRREIPSIEKIHRSERARSCACKPVLNCIASTSHQRGDSRKRERRVDSDQSRKRPDAHEAIRH
jgi:hypothetical protein